MHFDAPPKLYNTILPSGTSKLIVENSTSASLYVMHTCGHQVGYWYAGAEFAQKDSEQLPKRCCCICWGKPLATK